MLVAKAMDYCVETSKERSRWKTVRTVWPILFVTGASLGGHFSHAAERKPNPAPQLAAPQFSVPGGVYTNNVAVRLTASSPSAVIRYTVNGSEPSSASPKYSDPIEIAATTLLRAKVFDGGSASSATVSQTYIKLHADLAAFSSNLPLVILNSFGHNVPHDQKVAVSARFIDPKGGRSTLIGPADFDGRGDLNIRGHTSLRYRKHSYHFKTKDTEHNPLKVSILGFPKDSDWVLYAPYPDKTLMRDVLGYELSNQMGRYASRTRFVEVFLSEPGGKLSPRDYLGVYVFEEKVKRGKHRVPIEKLEPDDKTEPKLTGGYIFKKDHLDSVQLGDSNADGVPMGGPGFGFLRDEFFTGPGGFPGNPNGFLRSGGGSSRGPNGFFQRLAGRYSSGGRQWFATSQGNQFLYVEPKAEEITAPQKAWLTGYLNKFEGVLYGNNFKDPKTGYAAYIDPDSFIDHHLLVEVSKNIDGFRFSTFYHKDRGGKITMGPIWDWNLSFGNANGKQGWMPERWYWPQLDDQQYCWFRRLFEDPDFGQRYVDRWGEVRTNQFAIAKLHARIDELAQSLEEAQARNFQRWRIMGRSVWPNHYVGRSFADEVAWMKQWIQKRIEWIDQQFLAAPSFSLAAGPVARGSPLALRAPAGKIYYSLDGTDPRAPGGGVSPAARLYGSAVVLNEKAVVFCRAYQDSRWSYRAVATFSIGPPTSGP